MAKIVAWHGEGNSVWYVVDTCAPESHQPAVLASFKTYLEALDYLVKENQKVDKNVNKQKV